MPLADRRLVDVSGEDQVGTRLDESGEHVVAARDGLLAGAPRRPDQVVMKDDDLEGRRLGAAQPLLRLGELPRPQSA